MPQTNELITPVIPWRKLTTNNTGSSYPTTDATPTKPATVDDPATTTANQIVIDIIANHVALMVHGTNAANETGDVRVIGWRLVGTVYVPMTLYEATATLGAAVGVDGTVLENEEFIADTLVEVFAPGNPITASPTGDGFAWAVVDCVGCKLVSIQTKVTTAASLNTLVSQI